MRCHICPIKTPPLSDLHFGDQSLIVLDVSLLFLLRIGVQSTDVAKLTGDIISSLLYSALAARHQLYLTLPCKVTFCRVSHMASHSNDATVSTGRKSGSASLAQILSELWSTWRVEMSLFQL